MVMVTRVPIDTLGHWLAPAAAASYARMLVAGLPAGGITDAGRTYAQQAALYAAYLAGKLQATAAKPGTSSHESGLALDVSPTSAAQKWLISHGYEHGWTRPLLRAAKPEPWHWQYSAVLDRHLTPTVPVFTPPTLEALIMAGAQISDLIALIRRKDGAVIAINRVTGQVKPVTFAAWTTIENAGLKNLLVVDDGAGRDLDNMDPAPFQALVDLLS